MDTATTPTPPDRTAEREHHRAILNELIDLGTDMARMVHRQKAVQHDHEVATGATVHPVPTRSAEFDLLVRCVRRTMHMLNHLDDVPKQTRDRVVSRALLSGVERREAARVAAAREKAAADAGSDRDPPENLLDDGRDEDRPENLNERLDAPDWHERFDTTRPPAEIIAAIRRDLGLPPEPATRDLSKLSDADLAALKQREAGSASKAGPRLDRTGRPERFFGIVAKPKRK